MPLPLFLYRWLPFGRKSEILGLSYLRSLGYRIVASPYRTKQGEVDIIAWDSDILVFIEVKSLHSSAPPEDAVGLRKRQRIIRAAQAYMSRHRLHDTPFRFDILAITSTTDSAPGFRLLRDAFHVR